MFPQAFRHFPGFLEKIFSLLFEYFMFCDQFLLTYWHTVFQCFFLFETARLPLPVWGVSWCWIQVFFPVCNIHLFPTQFPIEWFWFTAGGWIVWIFELWSGKLVWRRLQMACRKLTSAKITDLKAFTLILSSRWFSVYVHTSRSRNNTEFG